MFEILQSCCMQLTVCLFDAGNTCAPSILAPPPPEFSGAHHGEDSRGSLFKRTNTSGLLSSQRGSGLGVLLSSQIDAPDAGQQEVRDQRNGPRPSQKAQRENKA